MAVNRLGGYSPEQLRAAAAAAFNSPTKSNYEGFDRSTGETYDDYTGRIGKGILRGLGETVADEGYYRSVGQMVAKMAGAQRIKLMSSGVNPDDINSKSTIADALGDIGGTAFATGRVHQSDFRDALAQIEANANAAEGAGTGGADWTAALNKDATKYALQDMIGSQYSGGAKDALLDQFADTSKRYSEGYKAASGPGTFYNLLRESSLYGPGARGIANINPLAPPPIEGTTPTPTPTPTPAIGGTTPTPTPSPTAAPTVPTGPVTAGDRDPNAPEYVPDGYTLPKGYVPPQSDPEAQEGFKYPDPQDNYGVYASFVRNFGRPPMQYELNYFNKKANDGDDVESALANTPAARKYRETGRAVPGLKSFDDNAGVWALMEYMGIPEDQFDATKARYKETFSQYAMAGRY